MTHSILGRIFGETAEAKYQSRVKEVKNRFFGGKEVKETTVADQVGGQKADETKTAYDPTDPEEQI